MEALAALYWFLVISSIPAMFVVGCVYTYRAMAPRPPLVAVPHARVRHRGPAARVHDLRLWSGQALGGLLRLIVPTTAGFATVVLGLLAAVATYELLF